MKKVALLFIVLSYLSIGYSQLQYTYEVSHVIGNADASIEVNVTNGSGAVNYVYTWYDSTLTSVGTNSALLSGLTEGVYFLKVEDALDANINNYIYTYFWVGKYGTSTTLSVQPDSEFGTDAMLYKSLRPDQSDREYTNYGSYQNMQVFKGTWSQYIMAKALIKFDYNGLEIASASTVNLTLYGFHYRNLHSTSQTIDNEVLIKRVKEGAFWNEHTVTYNSFNTDNSSVNVENSGAIEISAQGALGSTVDAPFTKIVDISGIANNHINKTFENRGLFMELKYDQVYRSQYYYTSDHPADPTKRPKLTISFTLPDLTQVFYPLKDELDGGYYALQNNKLYFSYYERYTPSYTNLNYQIIDKSNTPVTISLPIVPIEQGENQLSIDFTSLGLANGFYRLKVTNEKNEVKQIRFKI